MPSSRRLRAFLLTAAAAGSLIVPGGTADAGADRVLVFGTGFLNDARFRDAVATRLTAMGHSVAVSPALPASLDGYDTVWHIGAFTPMTAGERDRLAAFVGAGGGLHLSGEFSCCAGLGELVAAVTGTAVAVGPPGSQPAPFIFEPAARDGVTARPNVLDALPGQSVGALTGVAGANILARAANGAVVGGAWGPGDMVSGRGRLTVLMDISWLTVNDSSAGSVASEARRVAVLGNLQAFLSGANSPPVVSVGGPVSAPEGGDVTVAGVATDPDGDPLVLAWSWVAGEGVDPGATCAFGDAAALSTSLRCTDDGDYTLTLTAADGVNPPVAASTTVTVDNVAPAVVVSSPASGAAVSVGAPLDVLATVVDPGGDAVACRFEWDDGTEWTVPVAAGVCEGAHVYAEPGMRTVTVTATDDDGGASDASVRMAVFDPAGGSVTGGGRVDGGTFSLSVRYRADDVRPTGSLRWGAFSARAFDWMVIDAVGTVVVQGTGAPPGGESQPFRLTVTPGRGGSASVALQVGHGDVPASASTLRGAVTVHR